MNTKNEEKLYLIKPAIERIPSLDYAFVFGSYLNKTHGESDLDLMLGSYVHVDDRIELSLDLEIKLGCPVDVISFHQAKPEVALRAFSKGLLITMNNKPKFMKDYLKCFYQSEDRKNLLTIRQRHVKMRYANG